MIVSPRAAADIAVLPSNLLVAAALLDVAGGAELVVEAAGDEDAGAEVVEAAPLGVTVTPVGIAVILMGVPLAAQEVAPYCSAACRSDALHDASWQLK